MNRKPLITLGSPRGIGYEIILLIKSTQNTLTNEPLVVIGSLSILEYFKKLLSSDVKYRVIKIDDLKHSNYNDDLVLINIDDKPFEINDIHKIENKLDGEIAYKTIDIGCKLVKDGFFSSLVTLPVSKENINIIDNKFHGHTEFIMEEWDESSVYMTFVSNTLKILLLTTHIPLKDVPDSINESVVTNGLKTAIKMAAEFSDKRPVCLLGLNPHAGENGLLGEEEFFMKTVVSELNKNTLRVIGPLPSDTAFTPQNINKFSVFVACYHDQGLIPFKMLSFSDGVNLSYGMKLIRTSVDHGTAVDLIGTGKADINSFISAYNVAVKLTDARDGTNPD